MSTILVSSVDQEAVLYAMLPDAPWAPTCRFGTVLSISRSWCLIDEQHEVPEMLASSGLFVQQNTSPPLSTRGVSFVTLR